MDLSLLQKEACNKLAGSIGAAASHKALHTCGLFSQSELDKLSNVYSELLARMQLSPEELRSRIDYFQEKQKLLEDHAKQQTDNIKLLEKEINKTREAKAELKQVNDDLEQRVEQRTHALTRANESLEDALTQLKQTQQQLVERDKMAALGGLVAGVAHEINTPIGVCLTAATHLAEEKKRFIASCEGGKVSRAYLRQFSDTLGESCDIICHNIERATQQLNSFKQVTVDQTHEDIRQFSLRSYIEEVLFSLKPKLKNRPITLELDIDQQLDITSYPGAISQIITNLVLNSLTHGFEPQTEGVISIKATLHKDQIQLGYSDDGNGVSEEHLEKLFDPFFTTKRGTGGSGLGTHIVYNLVTQRLKGKIQATSTPGKGLTYTLWLPATIVD